MTTYKELWEKALQDLNWIQGVLEKGQRHLLGEQQNKQEEMERLRQDLTASEPYHRWPLQAELERRRRTLKEIKEKIDLYKERVNSPYFSKIISLGGYYDDGFFISKTISDPKHNIIKYTAPLAALRYRSIGEVEVINQVEYTICKKQLVNIEDKDLLQLEHYEGEQSLICTKEGYKEQIKEAILEIGVNKENLQIPIEPVPKEEKKYVLGEIIAKMREEQDKIMRSPYKGLTLIKGTAGSGKTNIAFHRIVYLISEHNEEFKEENMVVFCFNVALKRYLMNILTELNIPKVQVFSLDNWFYSFLREMTNIGWLNYSEHKDIRFKKTRIQILPILHTFERDYQHQLQKAVREVSKRGQIGVQLDAYYILNLLYSYQPFLDYIGVKVKDSKGRYGQGKKVDASDQYLLTYLIYQLAQRMNITLFKSYDHIVVDEVQDIMPIQMALINNLHHNSMTLVGDVTQKIFPIGVDSWEQFNLKIDRVYELTMCHRSTLQTICFANELLQEDGDRILSTKVGKQGEKPLLYLVNQENQLLLEVVQLVKEIKEEEWEASVVIVNYRNSDLKLIHTVLEDAGIDSYIASRMNWEFSPQVAVTTYHQVKGLEFDYVLILGLNNYLKISDDNKEQVLYTVVTRAQQRVFLFCVKELPQLLKKVDPQLYSLHHI